MKRIRLDNLFTTAKSNWNFFDHSHITPLMLFIILVIVVFDWGGGATTIRRVIFSVAGDDLNKQCPSQLGTIMRIDQVE